MRRTARARIFRIPWPNWAISAAGRILGVAVLVASVSAALALGVEGPALLLSPILAVALTAFAAARFSKSRTDVALTIGDDGLLVERLTSSEMLLYRDIESVERAGGRLVVRLASRRVVFVDVRATDTVADDPVAALIDRFARARSAHRRGVPTLDTSLVRAQRPLGEWMAHLRQLTHQDGYRRGAIAVDDLWGVIEDGSRELRERAAAAFALRGELDAEGKARVRIAAEGCASPDARRALQAVVDDDDEAISAVLERL